MTLECESVTVKVPKAVMALLRDSALALDDTPEGWIEYCIVDNVRAGLDSDVFMPTPEALADKFALNPVFKELLGYSVF